jgi:hypothetical protein
MVTFGLADSLALKMFGYQEEFWNKCSITRGVFKFKHRSSNFNYPRVGAGQLFEFHEDIFPKKKIPALTPNLGEKFGFIKW